MGNNDGMGLPIINKRLYHFIVSPFFMTVALIWFAASPAWGAPKDPTGLVATAASSHQINLSWMDNATDETNYYIERSPDGSGSWTVIATLSANINDYSDAGLIQNTVYYYRVRCAVDAAYSKHSKHSKYSKYSNTASATTALLGAPTFLKSGIASVSSISLSWTNNTTYA